MSNNLVLDADYKTIIDSGNDIQITAGGNVIFNSNIQMGSNYINNDGTAGEGLYFDSSNNATFTKDLNVEGTFEVGGTEFINALNYVRHFHSFIEGSGSWVTETGTPNYTSDGVELTLGDYIYAYDPKPFTVNNTSQSFHSRFKINSVDWGAEEDKITEVFLLLTTDDTQDDTVGFQYEIERKAGELLHNHFIRVYGYVKHSGVEERVLIKQYNGLTEVNNVIDNGKAVSINILSNEIEFVYEGDTATYSGTVPGFQTGYGSIKVQTQSGNSMPVGFAVYFWDRIVKHI